VALRRLHSEFDSRRAYHLTHLQGGDTDCNPVGQSSSLWRGSMFPLADLALSLLSLAMPSDSAREYH